eukprot:233243_1
MNVYRDLLDTIHINLVHSFDMGMKIKFKQLQLMKQLIIKDKNSYIDYEFRELNKYLSTHKIRFKQIRGNRFMKNKFFCDAIAEKPLSPLHLNEENKFKLNKNDKIYTSNNNINSCEFGNKFFYWDNYKSSAYYISKKYDNFKLEIMDNIYYPLDISKFIETHIKANLLLKQSFYIRHIQSDGNNIFGIDMNSKICLENIMSLIFYCDFDILRTYLISTYSNKIFENIHELMERHREFAIWSRLLNETIQCFGNTVNNSAIDKYYVNVKKQYFNKFMIYFNRPISMCTKLNIANIYCPNNGIILTMKKK